MADKNKVFYQLDGLQALLVALGGLFLILFIPAIAFSIKGDKAGVTGSLVAAGFVLLGILIMGAFAAGVAFGRSSMREGAGMVLTAQQFDNKADATMMRNTTRIFQEGVRAARMLQQPDAPPLGPPSMAALDWMPPVGMLEDGGDGWDGE